MPLILFTGLPASGKTTIARRLIELLEEKIEDARKENKPGSNFKIVYHNDKSLGISHSDYYESKTEKSARGIQSSAVKRDLSKNTIVILDSLCYIKGFRYQLFCEAKNVATSNCVIHSLCPLDECLVRNNKTDHQDKWDDELIKQLDMRFEEPDNRNRWDSPLFTMIFSDPIEEQIDINEVWQSLVYPTRKIKPNHATMLKPANKGNFLQELELKTQDVINKVVQYQNGGLSGEYVAICEDLHVELPVSGVVSLGQLQRIRRTFIGLNRVRAVEVDRIVPFFVEYLNNSLNNI